MKKLTKRFPVGKTEFTALNNLSISFGRGEFTGLVGPSGLCKTTLLNIIGSLDSPSDGEVDVLGKSVSALTHKQSANLRNLHIGFIFQTYNLLPVYTVYENVEFALLLQRLTGSERKKAVMDALEWVGLTDKVKSRPSMLSGGECQRRTVLAPCLRSLWSGSDNTGYCLSAGTDVGGNSQRYRCCPDCSETAIFHPG